MTPLRQRMVEDLRLRNRSAGTIENYVRAVAQFARHFKRSPDQLNREHARQYLLHLIEKEKASWSRCNVVRCALQFFFKVTLGMEGRFEKLPWARPPMRLPTVLSRDEVRRLIEVVAHRPRDKALLMTLYGAGLRISEAVALKGQDIDSAQMLIHVRQGKGKKDRIVPLPDTLLPVLRDAWRAGSKQAAGRRSVQPPPENSSSEASACWLFPRSRNPQRPMDIHTAYHMVRQAARRAGIKRKVSPHTLRHTYATHQVEAGVHLRKLQLLLGHAHLSTTLLYVHLSGAEIAAAGSPLDRLLPTTPPATPPTTL
jgi:integrase/recombinase XerD